MELGAELSAFFFAVVFCMLPSVCGLLSPLGVNYEVVALMGIKYALDDPHGALDNWDETAVDPCSWSMVTCSADGLVIGLGTPSQSLSGRLSPSTGNLTNLQSRIIAYQDQSHQSWGGSQSSEHLIFRATSLLVRSLQSCPISEASSTLQIHLPFFSQELVIPVLAFSLADIFLVFPKASGRLPRPRSHKIALAFGTTLSCICLIALIFGFILWWRRHHNKQIFFDVNDRHYEDISLGNLKKFHFLELQAATNNFSSKNLIGKGGSGNVYKGTLQDGTLVAVKRLRDGDAAGSKIQFQTEVEMISLAVHRNLLRLYGLTSWMSIGGLISSRLNMCVYWQISRL